MGDRRQIVRRITLLAALAALPFLTGGAAEARKPIPPFAAWARLLYEQEIARHAAFARGERSAASDIERRFTPETRALIATAQGRIMPRTEPDGPILHVFLGWGALPGRRIELKDVRADGPSSAIVDLAINDVGRRLVVTGAYDADGEGWRIIDIHYGAGSLDESYVARLRRMATWPQR